MSTKKLTRREFLAGAAVLAVVPTLPKAEQPATPEPAQVTNLTTSINIPDIDGIKNPAGLVEYVQQMESRLAEKVAAWTDDGDPDFRECVRAELEAHLSGFCLFLAAVEIIGYGDLIPEFGSYEKLSGPFESAGVLSLDGYYFDPSHPLYKPANRQEILDEYLWGEEPPPVSENLYRFDIWRHILTSAMQERTV